MKGALGLAWKALEHNRGATAALLLSLAGLLWAAGCQSMAVSPLTQQRLTASQLAVEEAAAYAQLEEQMRALHRQYDAAFEDLGRQDRLKQLVFDWARPVAESFIGQVGVAGSLLTLLGVAFDNRRKDRVIRSMRPRAP